MGVALAINMAAFQLRRGAVVGARCGLFQLSRLSRSSKQPALCSTLSTTSTRDIQQQASLPWRLGKLNHVAIAVPNLEEATKLYRDVFGATVSDVTPLPEHGVYTVFIELGNTKLELLHPLGDKSPIEGFLKKKPEGGIHHVCIEVSDIQKAITELKDHVRPLTPEPKIGAHGKPVVFLHPKDCNGVLIELEQE